MKTESAVQAAPPSSEERRWIDAAWRRTIEKVGRTSRRIGDTFPHVSRQGRYDSAPAHWWTAGFWPGLLWLIYREEGDDRLRGIAESCESKLDPVLAHFEELHHDVGFMWGLTAVANFKLLGREASRRRALLAASILAARYNARGGFIRAWNHAGPGWAIIDSMMNLPLLFWASEITDDPRFRHIATAHAATARRHFLREDGSCRHVVSFDPNTGAFLEVFGGQGLGSDSAWARGCAWALYGFALCHRYTGDPEFLEAARRVAAFVLSQVAPGAVPPWDFHAPAAKDRPLDSSAGACTASGLLELARLVPAGEAARLRVAAVAMVAALDQVCGAWDLDEEGLLLHGTGNLPDNANIDVPLIYGDFFFVEALAKLRGRVETFW